MAHLIESMAYIGAKPWHGLGNVLTPKRPLEVWIQEAGMDWDIQEAAVKYVAGKGLDTIHAYPEQKVLYRSDTHAPLSVVSQRYQVVQPREVLEFYRDLTEVSGFALETAGVLKGGKKFWALARTGQETTLPGKDRVLGYLLLATSCDGTLATTATPTTIRVVCNNTLSIALNGASGAIKVPHSTSFNAQAVKTQLGIAVSSWDSFMIQMKTLASRKVRPTEATTYLTEVLNVGVNPVAGRQVMLNEKTLQKVYSLFDGQGNGAELPSSKGTAWGLLNAVTEFVDHKRRSRSEENRLDSAWFGQGSAMKQKALDLAIQLAA